MAFLTFFITILPLKIILYLKKMFLVQRRRKEKKRESLIYYLTQFSHSNVLVFKEYYQEL